jgi:hypothetical protein
VGQMFHVTFAVISGMMLTGENGGTRKETTVPFRPSQFPHGPSRDLISGLCDERPASNCLGQGAARHTLDWRFSWQCERRLLSDGM